MDSVLCTISVSYTHLDVYKRQRQEISQKFISQLRELINTIVPCYVREGKYHLNIAFGCTGGQHRSVAMANRMAEIFREDGYRVTLGHRDL